MEPLSETSEGDALHRFLIRWRAYPTPIASPSAPTTGPTRVPLPPTGPRLTSALLLARILRKPQVASSRTPRRLEPYEDERRSTTAGQSSSTTASAARTPLPPQDTLNAALRASPQPPLTPLGLDADTQVSA